MLLSLEDVQVIHALLMHANGVQLWSGTDLAVVLAEMISAFTNSSTYTFEVAPVYSLYDS